MWTITSPKYVKLHASDLQLNIRAKKFTTKKKIKEKWIASHHGAYMNHHPFNMDDKSSTIEKLSCNSCKFFICYYLETSGIC